MGFKENLLKKIQLDQMKTTVLSTLGPSGSGIKVDKQAMKKMLEAAGYTQRRVRSLDLFFPEGMDEAGKGRILVLDNELAIYDTTADDVVLRKDPTVKEMVSIRNAIKILNDKDVVVSRKEPSVETVYGESLSRLDLSFGAEDIKQLEYDGRSAVEWKDSEKIEESIKLFGELLGYGSGPKALRVEHYQMSGKYSFNDQGDELYGPSVIFSIADDTIKLVKERVAIKDRESVNGFLDIVRGLRQPSLEGVDVIKFLSGQVMLLNNLKQ